MSAASFQGWLLRNADTLAQFPHELIAKDSYQSTPLQRIDLKSYRDNNVELHRIVSPNYKTKIVFSTIDRLTLNQLEQIQSWLAAVRINTKERKVKLEYWDDELLAYRVMNAAYQTDTTYQVSCVRRKTGAHSIRYKPIQFTFIEY